MKFKIAIINKYKKPNDRKFNNSNIQKFENPNFENSKIEQI